jgi:hypothetical protein
MCPDGSWKYGPQKVNHYMKSILFVLVLCLGLTSSAFAAESYICIGSKITFFIYDNTKVCRSITTESYNIYIVERSENTKYMWGVRKPGESDFRYLCSEDFNEHEYLSCDFGDFRMYKKNQIFLNSYLDDFCFSKDFSGQLTTESERNVPYIEIGRCHPF